ncbi:M56 family metallopeptidase [Siphonobacter curvatus]|uniref:Peptidase M56 domain-containing protein n=1 Tax=Siphonobacter curvatus TaxID=2094562 RepID=A0A2S7IL89_9BACT|nr:M56 family metallopeptidase [Siphonobacter curvatus]PQA58511.1 hypothetical protein C5O19_02235 [Siphonobacter curvatus]
MQTLVYLLQVSLSLAGFAGLYALLLKKETYYQWNRWYFWIAGIASLLVPAWNEWFSQRESIQQVTTYVPDLSFQYAAQQVADSDYPSAESIVLGLWLFGVLIMSVRLIRQLRSVYQLYRNSRMQYVGEQKVQVPASETAPFSFFHWIFMNPTLFTPQELKEVLLHEQIHARQGHSWDVLMGEMLQIVFWFNPLVWWWNKTVRQNLEYLADYTVLASGLNARHYQYHLLRQSGLAVPVRTHFSVSELKNRIRQINTPSSAPWKGIKLLLLLPLLGFWIMAFTPRRVMEKIVILPARQQQPVATDTIRPVLPAKIILTKKRTPRTKSTNSPKATSTTPATYAYFLDDRKTPREGIDGLHPDEIKEMQIIKSESEPTRKELRIYTREPVPIQMKVNAAAKPLYLVNGEEVENLDAIKPDQIESINVLKDAKATEHYGEKAKNGVILVTLKEQ